MLTAAFSGQPARGVRNRYVDTLGPYPDVPPYPLMHAMTRDLRVRAAALGRSDLQSLWAGQGVGLGRPLPAGELVSLLDDEVSHVLRPLAG